MKYILVFKGLVFLWYIIPCTFMYYTIYPQPVFLFSIYVYIFVYHIYKSEMILAVSQCL